MRQVRKINSTSFLLVAFLSLAAVGAAVHSTTQSSSNAQGDAQKDPTSFCSGVLDRVMPPANITPHDFPRDAKWVVIVRILPPFKTQEEARLSFRKLYNGIAEASMVSASVQSVLDQCSGLVEKDKAASLEKIAGEISLRHVKVSAKDLPQLSALGDKLEATKTPVILPDVLAMDQAGYEIWSQSQYGARLEMTLEGPGPQAQNQPQPLLAWVEELRRELANYQRTLNDSQTRK